MHSYPHIARVLSTVYNAENGLSLDASKKLYARMISSSPSRNEFKQELDLAFSDPGMSWKAMLCNDSYEVFDASTEQEAKVMAIDILLAPLAVI